MAIAQEWWDRWWEEDWSWEGLATKPWKGWLVPVDAEGQDDGEPLPEDQAGENLIIRRATLQDYWKRAQREAGLSDEDFLIRVEQKNWVEDGLWQKHDGNMHFTLIHLPPKWRDGSDTLKADPDDPPEALVTLLKTELGRAIQETVFENGRRLKGSDHRMQWSGGVLPIFSLASFSDQTRRKDGRIPISVTAVRTAFSSYADFMSAAFSSDVNFRNSAFSGDANFRNSAFSGDANFISAAFSGDADFMSAAFSDNVTFMSAAFSGNAAFMSAAFSGYADFMSAIFLFDAIFSGQGNSVRSDAVHAVIRPEPAEVGVQIYEQIEDIKWTARRSFPSSDFSQSVFMGAARFDNRDFHSAASFDGAIFFCEAEFHGSQLHRAILFTQTDFELALKPEKRQWQAVPREALERLHKAAMLSVPEEEQRSLEDWVEARFAEIREEDDALRTAEDDPDRSRYFERVEEGFRTLKHAMEERRNRGQEARFFKLELRARRMRRDRFVPWWERWISDGYRLTSDFGASIRRPLGWFVGAIFVFALLYWCMILLPYGFFFGEGEWPSWATWGEALSFSLGRVFPFGPWGDPETCSAIGQMLSPFSEGKTCTQPRAFGPGTPIGLRVLASFQSLIALVLVFLSGLAIRRRFQIN